MLTQGSSVRSLSEIRAARAGRVGLLCAWLAPGLAWAQPGGAAVNPVNQEEASYDALISEASELAERDPVAAAAMLDRALPRFPQDNEILLRAADYHGRAGQYVAAEKLYRKALERGLWPEEAHLGLGNALLQQGRCDEARVHFRSALVLSPQSAEARRGLDACPIERSWRLLSPPNMLTGGPAGRSWFIQPQLSLGGAYYVNNPEKHLAGAVALAVNAQVLRRLGLSAAYRYGYFTTVSSTTVKPAAQHELFFGLGYTGRTYGLALQYAFLADGSGYSGNSHHLGLSARWRLLGDIEFYGSASLYPDEAAAETRAAAAATAAQLLLAQRWTTQQQSQLMPTPGFNTYTNTSFSTGAVLRGELSWHIPLFWLLNLHPGVAGQWAQQHYTNVTTTASCSFLAGMGLPGMPPTATFSCPTPTQTPTTGVVTNTFLTGMLSVSLDGKYGSVWGGGKYGDEFRPVYFDHVLIYNIADRISYGAWAGGSLRLPGAVKLSLTYAWDHLRRMDDIDATKVSSQSDAHYLNLGVSRVF